MSAASNVNFDRLWAKCQLINARERLKIWETARRQPELKDNEIDFLDRAIASALEDIATAEKRVKEWWT